MSARTNVDVKVVSILLKKVERLGVEQLLSRVFWIGDLMHLM